MSTPANHPPSCAICHGTGWQPGPERYGRANGNDIIYTTVEPCTHHWSTDEPNHSELITRSEYLARLTARDDPELAHWQQLEQRWRLLP